MTLDESIEVLQHVDLFRGFGHEQLRLLAFSSETRTLSDHSVLFDDGYQAEGAMLVMKGVIARVTVTSVGPKIIHRSKPGSLIDEYALVSPLTRTGKAIAIGESKVLVLRRVLFQRVLLEQPHLAAQIQAVWRDRLRSTIRDLTTMLPLFESEHASPSDDAQ